MNREDQFIRFRFMTQVADVRISGSFIAPRGHSIYRVQQLREKSGKVDSSKLP